LSNNLIFDIIARDRASEELEHVSHHVEKLRGAVLTMGKYAAIGLGGLVAGAGLAAGAFGFLGLKTASTMEQAQIAFTTMLGSGQKAQDFLKQLQAFAAATPFEFKDLTMTSQQLLAMGFAAKDVVPTLTAIGDAVAGLGGGKDKIEQVTLAIGQMQAKGKIQSDELLQLTEAGIPALKILADKYGVTTAQMQDMVTKGKVLSSDAIPKLVDGLEHGTKSTSSFGGMMEAQSHTMAGLWSTLQDTVSMAAANVMKPLLPIIEKALPKLIDLSAKAGDAMIKGFGKIGPKVKDIAIAVGHFLVTMKEPAIHALEGIGQGALKAFKLIFSVAKAVLPDVLKILVGVGITGAKVFGPIVVAVLELAKHMKPVLDLLAKFFGWLSSGSRSAGLMRAALTGIVAAFVIFVTVGKMVAIVQLAINLAMATNPIFLVVMAFAALVAGLIYAYNHFKGFHDVVKGTFDWIKDHWKLLAVIILAPFAPIAAGIYELVKHFDTVKNAVSDAVTWIKDHWKLLVGILLLPVAPLIALVAFVATHLGKIKGAVLDAVHWIESKFESLRDLPGKVGGYFGRVKDAIVDRAHDMLNFVGGIPGQIEGQLAGLAGKGYNAGKALVQAIGRGISEWIRAPYDALKSGVSKLRGLLPGSPAKEGPLSGRGWVLYSGMAISQALATGIKASAGQAYSAAEGLMSGIGGAIGSGDYTAQATLQGSSVGNAVGARTASAMGGSTIIVNMNGISTDPHATARELVKVLQRYVRETKQPLQVQTI
jgi:tape measure domain-containing protein